jgi:hypothetical protein
MVLIIGEAEKLATGGFYSVQFCRTLETAHTSKIVGHRRAIRLD